MLKFTESPSEDARKNVMTIRRAPAKGTLKAVITSTKVYGTNTHWYGGRTVPCEDPHCEPCEKGIRWEWHGYVSAHEPNSNEHFLFEFTAQAHDAFAIYLIKSENLRGCVFRTSRAGGRPNGRVQILTRETTMPLEMLPQPPDIGKILCHIWGIDEERQIPGIYSSEHNGNRIRKTTQIKSVG